MSDSLNILLQHSELVSSADKEHLLSQRGLVIWMTGYPGAGKSTLAYGLEKKLFEEGILTKVLDDDVLRQGLNKDLGPGNESHTENIRRTAELARQLVSCGIVVICSSVTPTNALRELACNMLGEQHFILYHIATPLQVCQQRGVKARTGSTEAFTGMSTLFEYPEKALYSIDTSGQTIEESLEIVFDDIFPLISI